jgi:very-short-patch-repair endonuclease
MRCNRPLPNFDGPFRGTHAVAEGLLTPGQLRSSSFTRLLRDVYAPAGVRLTHRTQCDAAALIMPAGSVITGRSAAAVRGMELARARDPVEVVVDESERFGPVRGLLIKRTDLIQSDSVAWNDVRLASRARMGFDLARRKGLLDAVADVDVALRAGQLSRSELGTYLFGRMEHGVAQARRVVELADGRAASRPESMVRVLLRMAGLDPEVQYTITDAEGEVARVDFAFIEQRVAVEYDGEWHALRMQLTKDRRRMNRIDAAGWHIVFITADMLKGDGREAVQAVLVALACA